MHHPISSLAPPQTSQGFAFMKKNTPPATHPTSRRNPSLKSEIPSFPAQSAQCACCSSPAIDSNLSWCEEAGEWSMACWDVHPGRLTWNLRIHPCKREKNMFQTIIFRFYVNLRGRSPTLFFPRAWNNHVIQGSVQTEEQTLSSIPSDKVALGQKDWANLFQWNCRILEASQVPKYHPTWATTKKNTALPSIIPVHRNPFNGIIIESSYNWVVLSVYYPHTLSNQDFYCSQNGKVGCFVCNEHLLKFKWRFGCRRSYSF